MHTCTDVPLLLLGVHVTAHCHFIQSTEPRYARSFLHTNDYKSTVVQFTAKLAPDECNGNVRMGRGQFGRISMLSEHPFINTNTIINTFTITV